MSTGNFFDNGNGIYSFSSETDTTYLMNDIIETLYAKGYEVTTKRDDYVITKNNMIAAVLTLKDGYYEGGQILVTTDPDDLEGYSAWNGYYANGEPVPCFTKYHKRILNIISKYTTELSVFARFDNGETIYQ
jgi:hypothetical protein